MKFKLRLLRFGLITICLVNVLYGHAHEILFCGERIPVHNSFVAQNLMSVISRQIPNVNLPQLRKRAEKNFPIVEYYLRKTGLPEDLKYLAIVESGFQNLTSSAGARGFWQLMPETARELGLAVNATTDDRDDIYKSTYAACKVLASYYLKIRKVYGVYSWTLTAAAYNFGIGNISNAISKQGNDYFSMRLNPETALYVYKVIAVKELFEYPELYMKDFGYNVFNAAVNPSAKLKPVILDSGAFRSMVVKVDESDGGHPQRIQVKELLIPAKAEISSETSATEGDNNARYVAASIKGKYRDFEDGDLVAVELLENLTTRGTFNRKGNVLKGKGWLIGDRVYIDLGYGDHEVTLTDSKGTKGIPIIVLKNNASIQLKVVNRE